MNFRIQAILFFVGVFFINANAQKSKTIVDDTTKVIYGTNTAKIFTLETIYKEDRVFFNKDTLFDTPINKLAPNLELKFERPTLYNKEEAKLKFTADSIALLKKEEADKLALEATDTTAQRKKDSLNDPYLKFLRFFKAKPLKPLPYKTRFFKNEYAFFKSDTSIDRIQQYNMNYINDNIYQNLGVIGTPSKPVFLTQPSTLGYQSGYNVYNVYYTDPTKVRYFNSKSPYTNVYYVGNPGTTNEDRIKFDINRNITRNWNFGFSYERIYTDKLIGQSGSASRSLALGQEFIVYSSTKSRNGRYHFMANTNYFLFFANEQGGLARINSNNASSEATLLSDNELPTNIGGWPVELNATNFGVNASNLDNKIFSRDRRVSYYMYHQYDILKLGKLSVFYEFDRRNQRYTFGDPLTDISTTAGQNFYIGKYKTSGNTLFNQEYAFLSNKVGFKTHWGNFVAGAYYKNRYVMGSKKMSIVTANALVSSPIPEIGKWFDDPKADIRLHENYIGGFLKYKLADSIHFEFNGEFMASLINKSRNEAVLDSIIIQQTTIVNTTITSFDTTRVLQANPYQNYTYKGDYNFNFKAYVYNFELGLSLIRQTPSLVNYYSLQHNLYHWYQGLQPSISNNIYAKYHFNHKQFFLEINPSIYQLQNYVYFNSDVKPVQTEVDKPLFYGMMDVTFNTHVGILHLDTKFKYTYIPTNQPQVVRMPAFYVNPRIYIKYVPKSKINKQDFRFGFDIYYRSTYYGDVYMPSVGQFFVQNSANDNTTNFKLKENVLIDFFVTAKLRNARIFLKINQLNQLLGFSRGYYISPFYPATNGSFQLGVHWLLFD